eukprot:scaffold288_cov108-Isochrysis_galbana.AAC.2
MWCTSTFAGWWETRRAEPGLKIEHLPSPCPRANPPPPLPPQYTSSPHGCGYVDEASVQNKASTTETFAAAVLHVDNPRWAGVPFVLKAGHGITENKVELRVQFHRVPGVVRELRQCEANELVVRVQPEEAIYWKVQNKVPGLKSNEVEQMRMGKHAQAPGTLPHHSAAPLLVSLRVWASSTSQRHSRQMPKAYERLLLEVCALAGGGSCGGYVRLWRRRSAPGGAMAESPPKALEHVTRTASSTVVVGRATRPLDVSREMPL